MVVAVFRRDGGSVGCASTRPPVILYVKKESNDVPNPQAQRSTSQTPIIANMANVLRNLAPPESATEGVAPVARAAQLYGEARSLFARHGLPDRAELMTAAMVELGA